MDHRRNLDPPERDCDDGRADLSRGGRAGSEETRDREERSGDPRDVVTRGLDLPKREERELALVRDRTYELNGPESRTLATVGAFRVVRSEDLRDLADERAMRHLRDQGLVQPVSLGGRDRDVVVLTREGRDVLEVHRREDRGRAPASLSRRAQEAARADARRCGLPGVSSRLSAAPR